MPPTGGLPSAAPEASLGRRQRASWEGAGDTVGESGPVQADGLRQRIDGAVDFVRRRVTPRWSADRDEGVPQVLVDRLLRNPERPADPDRLELAGVH